MDFFCRRIVSLYSLCQQKVNIVGAMNLLAGSYDDVRRRRPRRAIVISGKKSDSATDAIAAAQKVRADRHADRQIDRGGQMFRWTDGRTDS